MSKTGGGRGTNQYAKKGFGLTNGTSGAGRTPAEISLVPARRSFVAVDRLEWADPKGFDDSSFRRSSVDRSVARLAARRSALVFNDASLEGNTFTEPEVRTLLEGQSVGGKAVEDVDQIIALALGVDYLINEVRDGRFRMGKATSDQLHGRIAQFEAMEAGHFRGETQASDGITVSALGDKFYAPAAGPGGSDLIQIYADGLARIHDIGHPVLRGATYAAFAAYYQFYFDGNKRTARYLMNGELMADGYDAIVTPAMRRSDYNRALAEMYRTGDASTYISFTLSCYDDPN